MKKVSKIGLVLCSVCLVIDIVFIAMLWSTKLLPIRYMSLIALLLLSACVICFGMQFAKKSFINIAGSVISILMSIVLVVGSIYVAKADKLMKDVGGAEYKTDNMVVVVLKDDKAENLLDAEDYRFGMQTSIDQDNNALMLADVQEKIGKEIKLVEYETVLELAEALLEGRIKAAVYNDAFTALMDESIEGYSDEVKVIYHYGIDTPIELEEEVELTETFHIYISGIDVEGDISTTSRSDVNILMTINPKTHQILLTNTPRDYYVTLPGISGDQKDKLTHAGIYGVDVSMNTLEELYGIDISYYAKVNFTSLITIIDALGGVNVYSEQAFSTGGYNFVQGMNYMNGEQALAFSRERYSFEDGDNQRGRNQQAVLKAIIEKAMSPAILTNANKILASVADSVETNMTQDEMAEFISMQLESGAGWAIESVAATGTGDNLACYSSGSQPLYVMIPDENSVASIKSKMLDIKLAEPMKTAK